MGSDKLEVLLCQIYSSIVAMCCKVANKHCRYSNLVWQGLQPHYRRPSWHNEFRCGTNWWYWPYPLQIFPLCKWNMDLASQPRSAHLLTVALSYSEFEITVSYICIGTLSSFSRGWVHVSGVGKPKHLHW